MTFSNTCVQWNIEKRRITIICYFHLAAKLLKHENASGLVGKFRRRAYLVNDKENLPAARSYYIYNLTNSLFGSRGPISNPNYTWNRLIMVSADHIYGFQALYRSSKKGWVGVLLAQLVERRSLHQITTAWFLSLPRGNIGSIKRSTKPSKARRKIREAQCIETYISHVTKWHLPWSPFARSYIISILDWWARV